MDKQNLEDQKRDQALYFVEDGEEGFDPEHNKQVIERTIQKAELMRRKRNNIYKEGIRERADAVATYLKSRFAEGTSPVERYFGKKWMSYLAGQKILGKLQKMQLHPKVANKGVMPGERLVYLPQ